MTAYYNEIDPYAAQWLRNLIDKGLIARGDVDERSIVDVRADDLKPYTQAHFFAGIGGWSIALRLAGWPDDRPVWTGSCPCQPFSAAGEGKAADDERHLWPAFFSLIAERHPAIVLGEQVEAAIGWGWLDAVFADLESEGYACGAAVLPACGVGAPHIRQRAWFVADRESIGWGQERPVACGRGEGTRAPEEWRGHAERGPGDMADAAVGDQRRHGGKSRGSANQGESEARPANGNALGGASPMVNAAREQVGIPGRPRQPGETPWGDPEWVACTDGKSRPIEPGSSPLAHGVHARSHKLRAYGNAIVPQVAAAFVKSYVDITSRAER